MTVCDLRTLPPEGRADRGVGEANASVAIRTEARALIDHVLATLLEYA
jgi:hypothetical protein